jgi:hypothetical protein
MEPTVGPLSQDSRGSPVTGLTASRRPVFQCRHRTWMRAMTADNAAVALAEAEEAAERERTAAGTRQAPGGRR